MDSFEPKNLARFIKYEKVKEKRVAETEEEKKDRHKKVRKETNWTQPGGKLRKL